MASKAEKKPARKRRPKSITVIGRRWFDKHWGNTYHSVTVLVDGTQVGRVDFEYGYGDHYLQSAMNVLRGQGYLQDQKQYENGGYQPLWEYCRDRKIVLHSEVADVSRKRDL